ncbi:MAG TPA: tetratricopeptide repeat protein [Pyrinomonadaceae bacterium]|jgi:tetratricopeptide (TPR) repeat protein|nr:tetratricopeptide repeat protein [Pyrinomonadaceae bacterium]
MGFDKAKVLRAAEKYLAQGKIPAAIAEYRQIVENDADDFMALNVLGDLYARADKKREAVACFTRIAEHYREQGFTLKAVAMYKKVERLQPGSADIASQLAALYESQGLLVEARAQYMTVADVLSRAGQTHKALEVLRRVADLDPENIDIRRRLAEGYARENLHTDAALAYTKVGDLLLARGQYENALGPYSLVLNLFPLDHAALSGTLEAHIALGTPQEAAEQLERAVAEQPDDAELLSMLARAHVESGDVAAAERSTAALVQRDKANHPRFVDVARLYLKEGDADAAVRVIGGIAQPMLAGREEDQVIDLLREVLAREPQHIKALRLLGHVHRWQRDEERLRVVLERLAEAARNAALVDEERNAVAQLARLVPDNQYYYDRLHELGDAPVEALYSDESIFDSSEPDVPSFESFASFNEPTSASQGDTADAQTAEFSEFEWNSTASEPTVEEAGPSPPPPPAQDPAASFADLNAEWGDMDISAPAVSSEQATQTPVTNFQEIDFDSVTMDAPSAGGKSGGAVASEQSAAATTATDPRREALLLQELESVDFYLTQGYADIAQETLTMLERQFGAHPAIDARRAQLSTTATPPSSGGPQPASTVEADAEASVEFSGYELYQIEEELPPTETNAEAAAPAPAAKAEQQPKQRPVTKKKESVIHPELADIFDEFRAAVEEDGSASSDDDYETHYNLGLAYSEMEMLDEAVEEFQIAAGLAAPSDGTPRYLQCCNLLGHCLMKKGMPRVAAIWFRKGLEAPGHTEDEYQALRYDLGNAYEQMGELGRAIETFTEVYGINVGYRGVAAKLNELKRMKDQGSDVRG